MSNFKDLVEILGGDEEMARSMLDEVSDWSDDLVAQGVAYKSLEDVEAQLEGLTFAELRALKDAISKLLTERKYPKKVKLVYKANDAHPPASVILSESAQAGIDRIEQARAQTKTKRRGRPAPMEITGEASIEAIWEWRKAHPAGYAKELKEYEQKKKEQNR